MVGKASERDTGFAVRNGLPVEQGAGVIVETTRWKGIRGWHVQKDLMTITREIIPRIEYNRKVADKWCADHKIADTVPRVTRQIETAPLNLQSLHPFAYNPSLIRVGEQVWMSYRYHPERVHIQDRAGTA